MRALPIIDRRGLEANRDPKNLRHHAPVPQVDYPCYACGNESTHEIIHRGRPLDVCDDPACVGEDE